MENKPILLVDDDKDFCNFINTLAIQANVPITIAYTCKEAFYRIQTEKFCGYIIDGYLPDGSGIDLIKVVRKWSEGQIPIAFISSAYRDINSFVDLKDRIQVDYVLNKPLKEIDVINLLKNLKPEKDRPATDKNPGIFDDVLTELRNQYKETIYQKIEKIDNLIAVYKNEENNDTLIELTSDLHKISGSAGSYGYPEVSKRCKKMENILKDFTSDNPTLQKEELLAILVDFIPDFKAAFQVEYVFEAESFRVSVEQENQKYDSSLDLYIINDDPDFIQIVSRMMKLQNLVYMVESDLSKAFTNMSNEEFQTKNIMFSKSYNNSVFNGFNLIKEYMENHRNSKTNYILVQEGFDLFERQEAIKIGCKYIITKNMNNRRELLTSLLIMSKIFRRMDNKYYRVLILDDDELLCTYIINLLKMMNITSKAIYSADNIYKELIEFNPDLLLLDLNIPKINGMDILKILRSDLEFNTLPIIIMSAESHEEKIRVAYNYGIDNYITKPINRELFKVQIQNYIRNQVPEIVEMYNRNNKGIFTKRVMSEIFEGYKSTTNCQRLSIVVIKVYLMKDEGENSYSYLPEENSNYFRNFLNNNFGANAIIANWNDDEFVILLENNAPIDLHFKVGNLIDNLRNDTASNNLRFEDVNIFTGISHYPEDSDNFFELILFANNIIAQTTGMGKNLSIPEESALKFKNPEIFLLDDDEDLIRMLTYAFQNRGFKVKSANFGREAIRILNMYSPENAPSLIILDRSLPDMDGIQVLGSINKEIKDVVPCLFLSSRSTEDDIMEGLKAGAKDYIQKPFSLTILLEKARTLMIK